MRISVLLLSAIFGALCACNNQSPVTNNSTPFPTATPTVTPKSTPTPAPPTSARVSESPCLVNHYGTNGERDAILPCDDQSLQYNGAVQHSPTPKVEASRPDVPRKNLKPTPSPTP